MKIRPTESKLGLGRRLGVALCVAALTSACGPGSSSDPDAGNVPDPDANVPPPAELATIAVEPTNQLIELDLNTPTEQLYTATGFYTDGSTRDLSGEVTWNLTNGALGGFTDTRLMIPGFGQTGVEEGRITASMGAIQGEAQLTVVAYRQTGPQQDFFFVLPYEDPAGAQMKPLDFSTDVPAMDVFFAMDATGSMIGEINNLQTALNNTVVPGVQAEVPDTYFGAGVFQDFPVDPYGSLSGTDCSPSAQDVPDQPFKLFQTITGDTAAVQTAVNGFSSGSAPIGCGNDWAESMIEGLYQIATGEGLSGPGVTSVPPNTDGIGGVGYREGTMPVVVPISDAFSHAPGENVYCPTIADDNNYAGAVAAEAHTRQETKDALNTICARVVGIASIEGIFNPICTGQGDEEDMARATGAMVLPEAWDVPERPAGCAPGQCCTDFNGTGRAPDADGRCPLVFRVDQNGSGLGQHIVTGIQMLARYATFDVQTERDGETADIDGNPLPGGVTTSDFVQSITPVQFQLPPPPPVLPDPVIQGDSFGNVTPGTIVSFDVSAYNDFLPQAAQAQVFRAYIRVLAGGCTELDQREVFILVPPAPIGIE